ncbi:UNVERIFIED_CONTAM: hypothetical protein Slati_4462300 [Sesamum latifolium]|uniref:Uncharacterized protein n=1 Tax=Sesamum latifolium TaxID=2727402 RepID=A0AAW2STT5_9LAMI
MPSCRECAILLKLYFSSRGGYQGCRLCQRRFEKCRSQVMKLNGLVDGFDQGPLDPTLDGNLDPYLEEDALDPTEQDEFASLINEVEHMV